MTHPGHLTLPVTLGCGTTTAEIGTVDVPLKVTTQPAGKFPDVIADIDMPAFCANLAAFLREAADEIETSSEGMACWVARTVGTED